MEITRCLARHQRGAVAALVCVLGTMVFCWAGGPANAQTPDAFAQNKRLGRGVNILGYDPIWKDRQKARFQEKYFRLIKEAGFNHVRINLHPFRDNKLGPDYKLSAAWFETLDWAVRARPGQPADGDPRLPRVPGDGRRSGGQQGAVPGRVAADRRALPRTPPTTCSSRSSTSRTRSSLPNSGTPCFARPWRSSGSRTRTARWSSGRPRGTTSRTWTSSTCPRRIGTSSSPSITTARSRSPTRAQPLPG